MGSAAAGSGSEGRRRQAARCFCATELLLPRSVLLPAPSGLRCCLSAAPRLGLGVSCFSLLPNSAQIALRYLPIQDAHIWSLQINLKHPTTPPRRRTRPRLRALARSVGRAPRTPVPCTLCASRRRLVASSLSVLPFSVLSRLSFSHASQRTRTSR